MREHLYGLKEFEKLDLGEFHLKELGNTCRINYYC